MSGAMQGMCLANPSSLNNTMTENPRKGFRQKGQLDHMTVKSLAPWERAVWHPQVPCTPLQQLTGPRHREIPPQHLACGTASLSRCPEHIPRLASWELLVHLVEESPGHFRTKGNICSLLKTKPCGDTL